MDYGTGFTSVCDIHERRANGSAGAMEKWEKIVASFTHSLRRDIIQALRYSML